MNYYILRYGEIALKGKNRSVFEKILKTNISRFIYNYYNIKSNINAVRGRLILEVEQEVNLQPIFGLISYSKAVKINRDIEDIKKAALEEFLKIERPESFKVETHRLDKSFKIKSPEVSCIVGEVICEKSNVPVKMKDPALTLGVEIHGDAAYIFVDRIQCFTGMPLGSADKIAINVSDDKRTILSALSLMKRGCSIVFIGEKQDFNLIKLFNNYREPDFALNLESADVKSFADPNNFKDIEYQESNLLTLYPIALLSDKEVEEELNKYGKIQEYFNSRN